MSTIVYKYGLLPPTAHGDVVRDQMRTAHRYRNDLIAIERGRRDASRALMAAMPALEPLQFAIDEAESILQTALKSQSSTRAQSRTRSETAEQREAIKVARDVKKAAVNRFKEAKRVANDDPAIVARRKEIYALASELAKNCYDSLNDGLAWGTRALVIDALEQSVVKLDKDRGLWWDGEPNDPGFKRFTEAAHSVGVAVNQNGLSRTGFTIDEFHSCAGKASKWLCSPRPIRLGESRRSGMRTVLRMRVGPNDERAVMAEWPMVMHRPLPAGAIIRYADVTLRKVGPREEWSVQLTLDTSACVANAPPHNRVGAVAVDIGWLSVPNGIRVATWVDGCGGSGHLVLSDANPVRPPERRQNRASNGGVLSSIVRADTLRATRDKNFDVARAEIAVRLDGARVAQWKSPARLASLARPLEKWRYHDHHLWEWETSQRKKAERRRKDEYRKFAATLARKYDRVIVSDVDYADLARRNPKEEAPEIARANRNRQMVAPGGLREAIAHACNMTAVSCAWLSSGCPACGLRDESQRDARTHDVACLQCTYVRDADTTACLNMLSAAGFTDEVAAIIERGKKIGRALRAQKTKGISDATAR